MEELVRIALVGTGKRSGSRGAGVHPIDSLLAEFPADDDERLLLLRAGLQGIYEQAGRKPDSVPPLAPAPDEMAAAFSERLGDLVRTAMAADDVELVRELAAALSARQRALPHDLLPEALNVTHPELREHLLPVLGERGRWLSRFKTEWSWATADVATLTASGIQELRRCWDEGNFSERCRAIARLRRVQPSEAVGWLSETFKKEKVQHRVRLLEQLDVGLNAADEAFLNEALADRSDLVRGIAAALLARLPDSALARRMRTRAEAHFQLVTTPAGIKLACHPPHQVDRDWIRDGIPQQPPAGRGQRAYWTETLVAHVPLSFWWETFRLGPAELLGAVREDPFADAVLAGWTAAAARCAGSDPNGSRWAAVLWEKWADYLTRGEGANADGLSERLRQLLPLFEPPLAEQRVAEMLTRGASAAEWVGLTLLPVLRRPWSKGFASRYINRAREVFRTRTDEAACQWGGSLRLAARAIPRECFEMAVRPWEFVRQPTSPWQAASLIREADRFQEIVHTRERMYVELDGADSTIAR